MQIALSAARRSSKTNSVVSSGFVNHGVKSNKCADLTNNGAYFTIDVGIGTPEQKFKLVADTGSDALIIPDCRCVSAGYCEALSTCFSTNVSSSFELDIKRSTKHHSSLAIMGAKMNYGSGQIQVLVASEHVKVAGISATMHNGVFLMEDRRSLKVNGGFEGILGLGLPHHHPLSQEAIKIPSFMESGNVDKYSVCFNEWPNSGALRVHDSLPNPMTNIGTVHWGLDLHGFSVANSTSSALFCNTKAAYQKTACGAIPDSGTTLLMGPSEHIKKLYAAICDNWPRCKKSAEDAKEEKDRAFHEMLYSCESWMTDDKGVNEIPSIFLHLAGKEGKPQSIELSAWAYIVETTQDVYKVVTAKIFGAMPVMAAIDTGKKKKICTASFGVQEYNTAENGQVWILGAPLFYATTVGYDLGGGSKPQMAFIEGPCSHCNETTSLLSSGTATRPALAHHHHQRPLRRLAGPIREPSIDMNRPL